MNKKEIEFYLKFHREFRKNHDLNSALKSNLLRWSKFEQRIIFISNLIPVTKVTSIWIVDIAETVE